MHLIIMYNLKKGVKKGDFETWVKSFDYPNMRGLARVKSFTTYKTKKLLLGEGKPSKQYIELFEIPDGDGFISEDMPGKTVQNVMGQFMGFADAPEFMICSEVK